MFKYKISKDVKERMEREFRQYWQNTKELQELEKNTVLSTKRLLYIRRRLDYIDNVINRLKPFEKQVFYLIFKDNCDSSYCEINKNISKSTYYNIYNKSIYYLAQEWGEI